MSQDFKTFTGSASSPALDAFPITPGGGPLEETIRGFHVTIGGSVTVITYRGNTRTFTVGDGQFVPLVVTEITAATATGIVGYV